MQGKLPKITTFSEEKMNLKKGKRALVMLFSLFLVCGVFTQVFGQASVGDAFIVPSDENVLIGNAFTNSVHVNTSGSMIAAYGMTITFDPAIIAVDTGIGTNGVQPGADGFVAAVSVNNPGTLVVSGFDTAGAGPSTNLELFIVNWNAIGLGTTQLGLSVDQMVDPSTNTIGFPYGIGGSVTVTDLLLGDVNDNGLIDIVDALLVAQAYVGLNPQNYYPAAADVNANGVIDIVDALLIAQFYVGLISEFPGQNQTPAPTATPGITAVPTVIPLPTDAPTQISTQAPTPAPTTPVTGTELIQNGDFSNGTTGWLAGFYETAAGSASVSGGQYHISITNGGTALWHIQITQGGLSIQNGMTYAVSFDARADGPRTVEVRVGMSADPYTGYSDTLVADLTTTMSSYSFQFTMTEASDTAARIEFNCGTNSSDIYLDNVSVLDLSGITPAPTATPGPTSTPGQGDLSYPHSDNPYPYGIASVAVNQATEDSYVLQEYNNWKSRYVTANGASGFLRVQRPSQSNDTVSEGIGYGMLFAVYFEDRTTFDGLWNYAKLYFDARGLMHWHIDANGNVVEQNAAIDADEDMAIALVFADVKWGGYSQDATNLINNIYNYEIEAGTYVVKPGDMWGGSNCTNISYFAPADYKVFAQYTGNNGWYSVVDKCYEIINLARNSSTYLVPDWCTASGTPASEVTWNQYKDHYYYDAVRTPWRIALDYLWFGDSRAYDFCNGITGFFQTFAPSQIVNGYYLDGRPIASYHDPAFVGTAGAGSMASGYNSFAQSMYPEVKATTLNEYYQSSLRLFALMVMSGNSPNLLELSR